MDDTTCIESNVAVRQTYGHSPCKPVLSIGPRNQFGSQTVRYLTGACAPSRDGKQIFAIGTKSRGEVVRYDMQSHQFVPFLSGISAFDPNVSRDGQWIAYTSYPDHTLWRSRSDGSERRQLTYPPMEVGWPFISPDGTRVAFTTTKNEIYVIGIDGGQPQKIKEKDSSVATWSPDSNLVVLTSLIEGKHLGDKSSQETETFDLRTGKSSVVPSSVGTGGAHWIAQDALVAANETGTKFLTFDFKPRSGPILSPATSGTGTSRPTASTSISQLPALIRRSSAFDSLTTRSKPLPVRKTFIVWMTRWRVLRSQSLRMAPRCSPSTSAHRKSTRSASAGLNDRAPYTAIPRINVENRHLTND